MKVLCLPSLALVISEMDAWIGLLYKGYWVRYSRGCSLLAEIFHIEGKTPSCKGMLVIRDAKYHILKVALLIE